MSDTCLPSEDRDMGLEWANKKAKNSQFWTIHMSFKKDKISMPVQPSNPAIVCVEFLLDAYNNLDQSSVKILHKGRKLDMWGSFDEQGVVDGSKLMLIASATQDIDKVKTSKSDPTIRGFDDEKQLSHARERGFDPTSSSVWRSEQHKEHKFSKLEMVGYEVHECTPHPYQAQALLSKLATDPGIVSCMCQHKWHVSKLCEMDPRNDNPKQEGACTLGYNENYGARIYIRLRTDDLKQFRPYRELINTLLHELAHNAFGPHNSEFWTLFSSLKLTYLSCHAELQRKGTIVGGVTAGKLADISDSGDAQDIGASVSLQLTAEAANSALSASERAAAAVVAGRISSLPSSHSPPPFIHPSSRVSARVAAATAAEERMATTSISKISTRSLIDETMERDTKVEVSNIEVTSLNKELLQIGVMDDGPVNSEASTENGEMDMVVLARAGRTEEDDVRVRDPVADQADISVGDDENWREKLSKIEESLQTIKVAQVYADAAIISSATSTISVLSKIVNNILANPQNLKYRTLKSTSNVYKRTLAPWPCALDIIEALGFHQAEVGNGDETALVVAHPNLALFSAVKDILLKNI